MPPNAVESGIKDLRVHFLRETVQGAIPTNPAWLRYSDSIMSLGVKPSSNPYMQQPVGYIDPQAFMFGPEDHELTIGYHLQKWFCASGAQTPNDAALDGIYRNSDGSFANTHAFLARQKLLTGGILSSGRRVYTVGYGGFVSKVDIKGDPNTGEPLMLTLNYRFEKLRSYEIAQPASATAVTVESTSALDTSGPTVKVENDGAGTTATLTLSGTTPVSSGATTFSTIDAVMLSAQCVGDIILKKASTGEELCRILGKTSLGGYEGDLGVPALGSGSFEGAIGDAYQAIIGSSLTKGGTEFEENATIRTFSMMFENSLEISPRLNSRRRKINEGSRKITSSASIFSEVGSHKSIVEHLKLTEGDIVWTLLGGTITQSDAILSAIGDRVYESQRAVMTRNNVFTAKGVAISNGA